MASMEDLVMYRDSLARLLTPWRQEGKPRTDEDLARLWQELCEAGWGGLGVKSDEAQLLAL